MMTESDEYILEAIKALVWSGFYSPEDVDQMIDDILEDDADEAFLHAAVAPEFKKKAEEEKHWPETTDCDRLDMAFSTLEAQGILALHNPGLTMSDGHEEAFEIMQDRGTDSFIGYCFYHGQDMDRALTGYGLWIAFDHIKGDVPEKLDIGNTVKAALQNAGFEVEWDGSSLATYICTS
jgi:hypothetical protein